MGHVSIFRFLGLCAGLALVMAPLPGRAQPPQPARDICVEIFPPAVSGKISSAEVAIRDCNPPSPFQNPPQVLPALNFNAVLEVFSEGKRVCGTTTQMNVFMALPAVLSKVFRFQVVYTLDPGPSQLPGQLPSQPTRAVVYTIRASAQVDDGSPANNQSTMTVRFPPGGKASCVVVPKPQAPKHGERMPPRTIWRS